MGMHCSDCMYASFSLDEKVQMWQGSCSRGYTLADPAVRDELARHFAADPSRLVPVTDPFGKEYLRSSNVCKRFARADDAARATI